MARGYIPNAGGSGSGSEDVTATRAQVLAGYTAITSDSNDEPAEGSIASKAAATYNTSASNQTIAAGQYLSGAQTIRAVTTSGISAGNIKYGATVKVGDAGSATRIANVAGTYTSVLSSGQTAATAAQILSGYSAFVNGSNEIKGSIASKAAATFNTSASDRTIAAGQYLSGAQTIKAVTTSGISAANIRYGATVKVGDANSATRIANVAGTYTSVLSDGQTAMAAAQLLTGYSGFVNGGSEIKGSMANKGGSSTTWKNFETDFIGSYTSGEQIRIRLRIPEAGYYNSYSHVYVASTEFGDAAAANVLTGQTFTSAAGFKVAGTMPDRRGTDSTPVGTAARSTVADDTNDRVRMYLPSGGNACYNGMSYAYAAYSTFGNAAANQVLDGKTFTSSAGFKVEGTITSQAAKTWYATTSEQTVIAAGKYASGAQKLSKLTQTNLSAANIISGKTITINNGSANVWSVAGSAHQWHYKYATATGTTTGTNKSFKAKAGINTDPGTSTMSACYFTISNVGFTPIGMAYVGYSSSTSTGYNVSMMYNPEKKWLIGQWGTSTAWTIVPNSFTSSSIIVPCQSGNNGIFFIYGY